MWTEVFSAGSPVFVSLLNAPFYGIFNFWLAPVSKNPSEKFHDFVKQYLCSLLIRLQRTSLLQLTIRASWSKHLLAQTSFQLAPKAWWRAKLFHSSSSFEFLKKHHLPVGQVKNRVRSLARKQNPLAPGYRTLLSLHAVNVSLLNLVYNIFMTLWSNYLCSLFKYHL